MLSSAVQITIGFYKKVFGDIVITLFASLATVFSSMFDICKLGKYIENEYLLVFVYFVIILILSVIPVFFISLCIVKLHGVNIEFRTEERLYIRNKLEFDGRLVEPICLTVKNNGNEKIDDCYATLEYVEKICDREKVIDSSKSISDWEEVLQKEEAPRLKWVHKNISDSDCKMTIGRKSDSEMVEVAMLRITVKSLFSGVDDEATDIGFCFCGKDKYSYKKSLGLYKIKIRVDGKTNNGEFTKYFDGYLYVGIEKVEQENGFYIVRKFREGDPMKDKEMQKIYGLEDDKKRIFTKEAFHY